MIIQALEAMAQGMLGIFVVMGLIIGTIQLLGKMGKKN